MWQNKMAMLIEKSSGGGTMKKKTIGNAISELCFDELKKNSLAGFATDYGFSPRSMYRWYRDESMPEPQWLVKLYRLALSAGREDLAAVFAFTGGGSTESPLLNGSTGQILNSLLPELDSYLEAAASQLSDAINKPGLSSEERSARFGQAQLGIRAARELIERMTYHLGQGGDVDGQ
jgi:hypothetical protein